MNDEWGISKAEQASRLNSIPYGLLNLRPPRLVPLAHRLIAQLATLYETPHNLDAHGRALHQLGQHAEALTM